MGNARVTVQNVRIVGLDLRHHLVLLEGAVPGAEHGLVIISKSVKRPGVIKKPHAFQVIVEEEARLSKGAKAVKAVAKK